MGGVWLRLWPARPVWRLQALLQQGKRWRVVIDEPFDRYGPGVVSHCVTALGLANVYRFRGV